MTNSLDMADWPSLDRVILPARALLLSWRDQTIPARHAALQDAVELFENVVAQPDGEQTGITDMAALAVVAEAMQPFEDLAYLSTAWDTPYRGLANYVRATVYSARTPSAFWQRLHKRDDGYFDVFAGFAARNPSTGAIEEILDRFDTSPAFNPSMLDALHQARVATRRVLRQTLVTLALDWRQFGDYFYAYKHGGLAVHRPDVRWHNDENNAPGMSAHTATREPSLAVWLRGGKATEGKSEFGLNADQIVKNVAAAGRCVINLTDTFVACRLASLDAIVFDAEGAIVNLEPLQLPWTVWLGEADLTTDVWSILGRGPRFTWTYGRPGDDRERA